MNAEQLHVVGVYSNPRRYNSRARLLREWMVRTLASGVSLTVVEHAFGERPFELNPADWPAVNIVQVRGGPEHELWLKEALVNLGFSAILRAHPTAKYLCWEDADIEHLQPDWAERTLHMLQHNRVGQTWTSCFDLDPRGNMVCDENGRCGDRSFSAAWVCGDVDMPADAYGSGPCRALLTNKTRKDDRQHWGYSWAGRVDAIMPIGGLMDWFVTGAADYMMAFGFSGKLHAQVDHYCRQDNPTPPSPGYVRRLRSFARLCHTYIKQDIGCVDGTIAHHWHGKKRERWYLDRSEILVESGFDPDVDLVSDVHGLPRLCTDNRPLRDGLRRYNMQRNEDSVDLY